MFSFIIELLKKILYSLNMIKVAELIYSVTEFMVELRLFLFAEEMEVYPKLFTP